jgi:hypothetical protein
MPSRRQTTQLRVEYESVIRGLKEADTRTRREVRAEIRHAGESVRADAGALFTAHEARKGRPLSPSDARTAAGYRTIVRARGVAVEQKLRRTTGKHPEFGKMQMRRALVPALEENEDKTYRALESALDKSTLIFNGGL